VFTRSDTGKVQASLPIGWTAKGNVRRISKSFDTKAEALQWLSDQRAALGLGVRLDRNATLREVYDDWLANGEKLKGWAPATKANYQFVLEAYVLPQLGHVQVRDLTTSDFTRLLRDHADAGASLSMLHRIKRYAGTLLESARTQRLVVHNPVRDVELQAAPDPRVQRWSEAEVARVVRACLDLDTQSARYVLVAIGTGLRIEELLGLTWSVVDLDERVLEVRQVATDTGGVKQLRAGGKTENSVRVVPFDDFTAGVLRAQREHVDAVRFNRDRQNEKRAQRGLEPLPWADLDLVFCTRTGTVLDRGTIRRHLADIVKEARVPPLRLYATRHTHGSLLADAGVNLHALAERLGHADRSFTARRYLRGSSSAHRAVAEAVGGILEAARSSVVADDPAVAVTETPQGTMNQAGAGADSPSLTTKGHN